MSDRCFTVRELAERWRISKGHVLALITSGRLAAFNLGTSARNCWRVTLRAVEEYEQLHENKVEPKPRRNSRAGRFCDRNGLRADRPR